MAEKDTAAKYKMRKTAGCNLRKPLRDVSNRKKSASNKTALKQKVTGDDEEDYSLDRLLIVQSEISSLLHQIDGLVVQAFKLESTREAEKIHINSFTQVLSGTLESLKPWIPRFEKLLVTACKASSDSGCQEIKCDQADKDDEDEIETINSPEVVKTKSLVSPSPLVSWRDYCTVQRGKRLFLLTPMPKTTAKTVMSKQHNSVKSSFDKFSSAVQAIPRFGLTEITCGDLLKRQRDALLMEEKCNIMRTPGCKLASTPKFSFRDGSMLVVTPGFKMSPPRSCVLLEPVLESSHQDTKKPHKSTPYPAQLQHSSASEMPLCSSQFNEDLAFKCLQLVGMNSGITIETDNKEVDPSLSFLTSPPKTCVLMEPPDMQNQKNLCTTAVLQSDLAESDEISKLFPPRSKDVKRNCTVPKSSFKEIICSLPEGTPMWKNFESAVRSGRRPGENTLKKELWTKFEAASRNDFSFYASPLENDSQKGFLDRLEEVSGEETFPLGPGLFKHRDSCSALHVDILNPHVGI